LYLLDSCNHRFCQSCLQGYLTTKINDGAVKEIKCPDPKCTNIINVSDIKHSVTSETFTKYEKFTLHKALQDMKDVTFCPKAGCNNAMISGADNNGTGNDLMMKCSGCNFTYCTKCKEEWHSDSTCEQYQSWKLENNLSEKKYAEWVKQFAKPCPQCHTPIEKNGGCNHMTCKNCNHEFCWLCNKVYKSGHFGTMLWSCKQYT